MGPEAPVEIASQVGVTTSQYFEGRPSAALIVGWRATPRLAVEADVGWAASGGYGGAESVLLFGMTTLGNPSSTFQMTYTKVASSAHLAGRWTPAAGVVNLAETVELPLEFYVVGGVGVAVQQRFALCPALGISDPDCPGEPGPGLVQQSLGSDLELAPVAGFGLNLFLTPGVAVKVDVRDTVTFGPRSRCCFVDTDPSTLRAYGNVVSTVGFMARPRLRG